MSGVLFTACKDTDNGSDEAHYMALYKRALDHNDLVTANVALNQLVLLDSSNLEYKDSLSRIYIRSGNMVGGVKLGQSVLDAGNKDVKLQELVGFGYQQMYELDKSTAMFESLFTQTGDFIYKVEVLKNLMFKGNHQNFYQYADKLLATTLVDQKAQTTLIRFEGPYTQTDQYVPLEHAIICLKGQYALNFENQFRKAIRFFKDAANKNESFELPKFELQRIEAAIKSGQLK